MSEEQSTKFHDVLLLIIFFTHMLIYVIEFSRYSYVNTLLRREIQITVYLSVNP